MNASRRSFPLNARLVIFALLALVGALEGACGSFAASELEGAIPDGTQPSTNPTATADAGGTSRGRGGSSGGTTDGGAGDGQPRGDGGSGVDASLACAAGRADCNGNAADGCETKLTSDSNNCGACGKKCAVTEDCSSGTCKARPQVWSDCRPGYKGVTCRQICAREGKACGTQCGSSRNTVYGGYADSECFWEAAGTYTGGAEACDERLSGANFEYVSCCCQ